MFVKISLLFLLFVANTICAQTQLKLSDALQEASLNNPSLRSERISVPIAESDFRKARLLQNPIFNIQYLQLMPSSMYYDRSHNALNAVNSQDWYQLTKKFQVFGQRQNRIELAKLNETAVKTNFEEAKRQVLNEVSIKWIDAWRALAYKNLAIKAADYLDGYLKENFDSIKGRSVMKEDEKLRFEILDDQYDLERHRADQNYNTIIEELKLLLGTNKDIEIDLSDTLEAIKIGTSIDTLTLLARENRNDIKTLQTMKDFSLRNVRYQRSLAIPAPEAGLLWNPQNTIPYAGVFFTQTLPFFDRNQTEVQKAKLNSEMADVLLENNMKKLNTEVKIAFSNYYRRKEMASRFKHNLDDSERLLQMVRDSYLKNKYSMVDLWEAEQTWVQSYTLYYDAFTDYRKSYINLLYQLNLLGDIH